MDGCRLSISSSWAPSECPCRAPRVCPPVSEPPIQLGADSPPRSAPRRGLLQPPEVPGGVSGGWVGRDPGAGSRGVKLCAGGSSGLQGFTGRRGEGPSAPGPHPQGPSSIHLLFLVSHSPKRFQASGSPILSPPGLLQDRSSGLPVFPWKLRLQAPDPFP